MSTRWNFNSALPLDQDVLIAARPTPADQTPNIYSASLNTWTTSSHRNGHTLRPQTNSERPLSLSLSLYHHYCRSNGTQREDFLAHSPNTPSSSIPRVQNTFFVQLDEDPNHLSPDSISTQKKSQHTHAYKRFVPSKPSPPSQRLSPIAPA
jgi:hypothetical protein